MLGGHLLATLGARSCADGTVRAPGVISLFHAPNSAADKTMRCGGSRERRLPLLGTATASPGRSQAMQNAKRRRLPPGLVCTRSPANAVQQAAAETGLGTVTLYQLRHSGASVDMPRQQIERWMRFEKSSLVGGKEHAQVRTQQSNRSRLRKTGSGSPNTVRSMRKNTFDRQIMLGSRHPVHLTRHQMMLQGEAVSA